MDSPESSVSSSSLATARETSWREWSQRESGEDGYKRGARPVSLFLGRFGDFSRGMLQQMKACKTDQGGIEPPNLCASSQNG